VEKAMDAQEAVMLVPMTAPTWAVAAAGSISSLVARA